MFDEHYVAAWRATRAVRRGAVDPGRVGASPDRRIPARSGAPESLMGWVIRSEIVTEPHQPGHSGRRARLSLAYPVRAGPQLEREAARSSRAGSGFATLKAGFSERRAGDTAYSLHIPPTGAMRHISNLLRPAS